MRPAPLLAIPGLMNDGQVWANQFAALGTEHQVIVPDLTVGNTIRSFAEISLQAVPSAPFALAGFSMGGYVALEIMRMAPERVVALALLDTSARPDTPESRVSRQKSMVMAEIDFDGIIQELLPRLIHPSRLSDTSLTDSIVDMARRVGSATFVRQQLAMMDRADSRLSAAAIRCPTLVLCGAHDVITTPELSRELASLINGALLTIIEGCGHMSLLEKPAEVSAALRSLLAQTRA